MNLELVRQWQSAYWRFPCAVGVTVSTSLDPPAITNYATDKPIDAPLNTAVGVAKQGKFGLVVHERVNKDGKNESLDFVARTADPTDPFLNQSVSHHAGMVQG